MNVDPNKIPVHVAMILDGNGRWAKKRLLPRTFGHRKGAFNIVDVAKACDKIGIKYLTMFCFSTENWNRPTDEVNYIMSAPIRYYKRYKDKIENSKMKVCFIGRRDRIPVPLLRILEEIEHITKDHTGLTLTLCVDYGSYDEITTATKEIAKLVKENKLSVEEITPELIESHLFTKDYPKLDLLIRTSGEIRISNYLLWQLGYAELYFTDTLWPDFDEKELEKAILSYQSRNRRFGGLNENK
ncbi:MAG: isoprenyl transferase [Roseburia sp.]|nr:isoprenyl transferase [Anaeroplasma bactoclasticum]MCM1196754.1 isoprenyl transferase [Roseburia sp.]MCM1556698.1 isoprenyl transferase [Anaeroplasma bactoclasticum]